MNRDRVPVLLWRWRDASRWFFLAALAPPNLKTAQNRSIHRAIGCHKARISSACGLASHCRRKTSSSPAQNPKYSPRSD
jgi:hypothetical protein